MSSNKVIHALYDDDDILLSAVKSINKGKYHIEEVYTPFPVHGPVSYTHLTLPTTPYV